MRLNVKRLETSGFSEDKRLDFSYSPDLSAVRQWGHAPYPLPAEAAGEVVSHLGMMTVTYNVKAVRRDPCARCLVGVETPVDLSFSHRITENPPPDDGALDDETVFTSGGMLDLDEMVASDLLLGQDQLVLCSPGCLGLCPHCGANLNTEGCGCDEIQGENDATAIDSRFAALLEYTGDINDTDQE